MKQYQQADDQEAIDLAQINVKEANDNVLVFRKLPYTIWIIGLFVCLCALYLIYHLALGHLGVLFEGYREGHWWQYFISFMMLIFGLRGLVFMYAGKVETLVFDRQVGLISVIKTTIFCKKQTKEWAMD